MTQSFETGRAISDSFALARKMALPILPYFAVLSVISLSLRFFVVSQDIYDYRDFLMNVIDTILFAAIAVAFYRRALTTISKRQDGLYRDVRNLFYSGILVYLLFGILIFLVGLFLVLFAAILLASNGFDPAQLGDDSGVIAQEIASFLVTPAGFILAILMLGAALGLCWVGARLVMFGVATVASQRIRVFQTWDWTAGNGLQVLLAATVVFVLSALPLLFVAFGLGVWEGYGGPTNIMIEIGLEVIFQALYYIFFLASHGFAVVVYNQLCPELLDVEEAFG